MEYVQKGNLSSWEVEGDQGNMLAAAITTIALFCFHFAEIIIQSTAKTNSKDPDIYEFILLPTPECHGFIPSIYVNIHICKIYYEQQE